MNAINPLKKSNIPNNHLNSRPPMHIARTDIIFTFVLDFIASPNFKLRDYPSLRSLGSGCHHSLGRTPERWASGSQKAK